MSTLNKKDTDLLAPTVPSDPNPQNLHLIVPSGSVVISFLIGKDL